MRLNELGAATDVPVTSVKFFLREGLLPPGEKLNATTARYGERHRHRLELIRDLRRVVGLPLSAVRAVVDAVERLPRVEMMGAVQSVVVGGAVPAAADPDDGPAPGLDPDGDGPLTAADVGAALGWTTATPRAWAALDAHLADMRRWGLRPSLASVLPYARAVDGVAAGELGPVTRGEVAPAWAGLGPDPSADQVARYVALGVHAHTGLLVRLLAVAQGHHAGEPGQPASPRAEPT